MTVSTKTVTETRLFIVFVFQRDMVLEDANALDDYVAVYATADTQCT